MKLAKYYGLASFHPSCRINQIAPNDVPTRMICSEVESAQGLDILNVQSWPFERQHAREKKFLWHFRTWRIMKNLDQAQHEMRQRMKQASPKSKRKRIASVRAKLDKKSGS